MNMKCISAGFVLIVLAAACDRHPQVIADLPAPQTQPATLPAGPTTQALLSGTRTAISLEVLPFTLTVPQGWSLQPPVAGMNVLSGPAPSGNILIQLNTRTISTDSIPYIESGAKKQQKSDPQMYRVEETRNINGTKVFERQELRHVKMNDGSPILTWTFTAYIDRKNKESSVYELNFIGLSEAQYNAEKDFLYSIMNSLQYVPADDNRVP